MQTASCAFGSGCVTALAVLTAARKAQCAEATLNVALLLKLDLLFLFIRALFVLKARKRHGIHPSLHRLGVVGANVIRAEARLANLEAKLARHALLRASRHDHVSGQAKGAEGCLITLRLVVKDGAALEHKVAAAPVLGRETRAAELGEPAALLRVLEALAGGVEIRRVRHLARLLGKADRAAGSNQGLERRVAARSAGLLSKGGLLDRRLLSLNLAAQRSADLLLVKGALLAKFLEALGVLHKGSAGRRDHKGQRLVEAAIHVCQRLALFGAIHTLLVGLDDAGVGLEADNLGCGRANQNVGDDDVAIRLLNDETEMLGALGARR
eukprot:m.134855 g.134855  ORF g.134855 m.134855 type:complete len:326 (-) comp9877_c0_seq2:1977-2954(-)